MLDVYRKGMVLLKVLEIIGSSRSNGNTEYLTDVVLKNIPHEKIYLKDLHIEQLEDLRHTSQGFQPIDDDFDPVMKTILDSDLIIFSTPIYWYSMSGIMKIFVDRFSQALRDERYPNLKDHLKTIEAFVVAVGGDNPRIKGLPLIQQFNYTFEFLNMPFSGYILGKASKPGEIVNDAWALSEAQKYNQILKTKIKSTELK